MKCYLHVWTGRNWLEPIHFDSHNDAILYYLNRYMFSKGYHYKITEEVE